ncbi:DUF4331 domain-containing protein [Actinoplanes sp. L3-i22]|uniref:DUF4331 domain-containing protein n=1 Tax=Actinoplanes sp. L3-i22 TaxID=2836373 RepID=UPI001C7732CD|nr:DUF4331 domain-containing protein [Actinoplanes sp. L3-i22]BCY07067.1 hypothetical protein L3i22_021550 [Actinoplanes sp. L3-i22]
MRIVPSTPRRRLLSVAALGASAALVATLAPLQGHASSHREAPLIASTPSLDNTDLYAFVSPDQPDTVTMVANWQPFEEANGGPNFYPFAAGTAYDLNIDNNGDAKPDITYRWTFTTTYQDSGMFLYNTGQVTSLTDPDLNLRQTYRLERITPAGTKLILAAAPVAPSFTGTASMPDYPALSNAAITSAGTGSKSFAGQADDPFFADLRIFDLLYGGDLSKVGQDTLKGYNVNTIALRVPKANLAFKGDAMRNPVVGIWSTTSRIGADMTGKPGKPQQVSRLGMPLVNEVVLPVNRKNLFNASPPEKDAQFGKYVLNPGVPKLIDAIYHIPAPKTPRTDLAEVFLTGVCKECGGPVPAELNSQLLNKDVNKKMFAPSEQLRLNMAVPPAETPNRLGVVGGDLAGFPNGRRLADDVIDVTLQAAEGILLPNPPDAVKTLGDGVDANSAGFRHRFPYIQLPNQVSVNQP